MQTIYYFFKSFINLLYQLPVTSGVHVGGILFAVFVITVLLRGVGLITNFVIDLKYDGF